MERSRDPRERATTATRRGALASGLGGFVAAWGAARAEPALECLRFGIFPYLPPLALERLFAPVVVPLAAATDRQVLMRTKPTFEAFEAELAGQSYDLAFVHPFLAVQALDDFRYRALVRLRGPFELAFFARRELAFAGIDSLRGARVVTPPARSAATMLARLTLAEHGLKPGIDVVVEPNTSKMTCVRKVLGGEAEACVLPSFAARQLGLDSEPRLVEFHRRQLPIGLSIVARAALPEATSARLCGEFRGWSATPEGRSILDHAGWPGFDEATSADYDTVREAARALRRLAGL